MTLFTALIGVFEALLFGMLGRIVDWLAEVPPALLWTRQRGTLALLAGVLVASPLLIALQTMFKHQAVVAIAHRLSTIAAMDRLIVIDRGHIVEQGDHRSLLALDGLYARLWAHQSGGFLGEEIDDDADDAGGGKPALVAVGR